MQHARKMILIPEDSVDKLKTTAHGDVHNVISALAKEIQPSAQTPGTVESRLDAQLLEILQSKTPRDDHEKWKLYNDVLRRYLFYTGQHKVQSLPVQETEDQKLNTQYASQDIVATIPKTFQRKAEGVLTYIDRVDAGKRLKWDAHGQVTLDGQVLPGVNIVDLIQDVVRARKNQQAKGWEHFSEFLHSINTPREFMGNPKFQRIPRQLHPESTISARRTLHPEISSDESSQDGSNVVASQSLAGISTAGRGRKILSPNRSFAEHRKGQKLISRAERSSPYEINKPSSSPHEINKSRSSPQERNKSFNLSSWLPY